MEIDILKYLSEDEIKNIIENKIIHCVRTNLKTNPDF